MDTSLADTAVTRPSQIINIVILSLCIILVDPILSSLPYDFYPLPLFVCSKSWSKRRVVIYVEMKLFINYPCP